MEPTVPNTPIQNPQAKNAFYTNKVFLMVAGLAVLLIISGFAIVLTRSGSDDSNNKATVTPTPTAAVTITQAPTVTTTSVPISTTIATMTPTPTSTQSTVKVYFSKTPESNNNFTFVTPVMRSTTRTDLPSYAIEQLIAGPQGSAETSQNLFTPIKLTGVSNCGGKDFGFSTDTNKKATIQFCRAITSNGVGDDARIKTTIERTLLEFPTVSKVVILTSTGACFGDMSGMNQCKN